MEFVKTKTVRFEGVAYKIRQLSPIYFMDKDNVLPINNLLESVDSNIEKQIQENKKELKDTIKEVLLIGVAEIRKFFSKENIKDAIEKIMQNPSLYSALFMEIIVFSLGLKKKDLSLFI